MNPTERHRPSRDESIEATAAAWLAQRDGGFTSAETAEFHRWLQADQRHVAAVTRLEVTWTVLQQLRDFRPEARFHPAPDLLVDRSRRKTIPFRTLVAPLALAAALAMVVVWWWPRAVVLAASPAQASRYITTVGGYQRTTLSDGSVMELNASTEVRVNYSPSARRVDLVRGEAHFTVAKNKERPFWVEAGNIAVRAVGTAFNVRFGDQNVEVLVTEGRVLVQPSGEPSATDEPVSLLSAGQRMVIPTVALAAQTLVEVKPETVAPDVIREELAWQGPRLVFSETPLSDVVVQFNRLNQVQLELGDAELGQLSIGGSFRAENVEAFVRLLAGKSGIVAERPDPNRIVLRKVR